MVHFYLHLFLCTCEHLSVRSAWVCQSERTTCKGWFLPPDLWVLGIELGSLGEPSHLPLSSILTVCVGECGRLCHVLCVEDRRPSRGQFSLSLMWDPGLEITSSVLCGKRFTRSAIPAPNMVLIPCVQQKEKGKKQVMLIA